jgi:hypothetical protein
MLRLIPAALFSMSLGAIAAAPLYEISVNAKERDGQVAIAPTISAPSGTKLRYEILARRQGSSSASSRQSGNVTVGRDGIASLSKLSFSVGAQDRCAVAIKVYEGPSLVASRTEDCSR